MKFINQIIIMLEIQKSITLHNDLLYIKKVFLTPPGEHKQADLNNRQQVISGYDGGLVT